MSKIRYFNCRIKGYEEILGIGDQWSIRWVNILAIAGKQIQDTFLTQQNVLKKLITTARC